MSHRACSVPHVCSQTCLSATSPSQPPSPLKPCGNNWKGNQCEKSRRPCLFFISCSLCVLSLGNCIPTFVLCVSSHKLGRRREEICEFLCAPVRFFHLWANSTEVNYQIFGPEPQVIQFGRDVQLLVLSHTFQHCFLKNGMSEIKVLIFGTRREMCTSLISITLTITSSLHSIGGKQILVIVWQFSTALLHLIKEPQNSLWSEVVSGFICPWNWSYMESNWNTFILYLSPEWLLNVRLIPCNKLTGVHESLWYFSFYLTWIERRKPRPSRFTSWEGNPAKSLRAERDPPHSFCEQHTTCSSNKVSSSFFFKFCIMGRV